MTPRFVELVGALLFGDGRGAVGVDDVAALPNVVRTGEESVAIGLELGGELRLEAGLEGGVGGLVDQVVFRHQDESVAVYVTLFIAQMEVPPAPL